MVTIVVPHVDGSLNPATRLAVEAGGVPYRFVELPAGDHGAYGRLFRALWREGETFVICEHDVIPTADQLAAIRTCGHQWCFFDYDDGLYPPGPNFGLVRFGSTLMADHPGAAESALIIGKRRDTEAPWWEIDSRMCRDLTIRLTGRPYGWAPNDDSELARHPWKASGAHTHAGTVRHAHVGPATVALP